ncbi:hypothetical protein EMN47_13760 [Prolixibacteraceae bacterium JC049]|nr:hypothetical protein [Prolixibacteraceae bacterium JC049]
MSCLRYACTENRFGAPNAIPQNIQNAINALHGANNEHFQFGNWAGLVDVIYWLTATAGVNAQNIQLRQAQAVNIIETLTGWQNVVYNTRTNAQLGPGNAGNIGRAIIVGTYRHNGGAHYFRKTGAANNAAWQGVPSAHINVVHNVVDYNGIQQTFTQEGLGDGIGQGAVRGWFS